VIKFNIDNLRNPLEASVYKALKARQKAGGYSFTYEQDKIKYTPPSKPKDYIPDFVIEFPSGHKRYIEVKGYLRPEDMKKMRLVKEQYPEYDIRIFFHKDNKLSSKTQMRYSDWSQKHGFIYAIGVIPQEWFYE